MWLVRVLQEAGELELTVCLKQVSQMPLFNKNDNKNNFKNHSFWSNSNTEHKPWTWLKGEDNHSSLIEFDYLLNLSADSLGARRCRSVPFYLLLESTATVLCKRWKSLPHAFSAAAHGPIILQCWQNTKIFKRLNKSIHSEQSALSRHGLFKWADTVDTLEIS